MSKGSSNSGFAFCVSTSTIVVKRWSDSGDSWQLSPRLPFTNALGFWCTSSCTSPWIVSKLDNTRPEFPPLFMDIVDKHKLKFWWKLMIIHRLLHRMNTSSEDWAFLLFSYKWCLTLFRLQTARNDDNTINNWSWSLIVDDLRESEEQFKSESNISWTVSFNVIRLSATVLQLAAISWRAEVTLLSHSESALWRVITTE